MRWPVLRSAVCVGLGILTVPVIAEGAGAQSCGLDKPPLKECRTEANYHLRLPGFWDPARSIPTVLLLHDAGGNGAELVDDERLTEAFLDRGFALLALEALTRRSLRVIYYGTRSDFESYNSGLASMSIR